MEVVSECSGADMFVLMLYDRIQKLEDIIKELPSESAIKSKQFKEMLGEVKVDVEEIARKQRQGVGYLDSRFSAQYDINRVDSSRLNLVEAQIKNMGEQIDQSFNRTNELYQRENVDRYWATVILLAIMFGMIMGKALRVW